MKKAAAALIGAATVALASSSWAAELSKVKSRELTYLLNAMEIVQTESRPKDGTQPQRNAPENVEIRHWQDDLGVTIILVPHGAECDPHREAATCPHYDLLIAAAVDIPDLGMFAPVVWRAPRRIGWDFVRWLEPKPRNLGKFRSGDPAGSVGEVSFEMKVCEAPPAVESGRVDPRKGGWWEEHHYEFQLGVTRATMTRLPDPPAPDPAACALY